MLVLAQRFYQDRGEISIEDLVTGLKREELVAVCDLLQALQGGASAIEAWLVKWSAMPAPRMLDRSLDAEIPEDGEFRLEPDPVAHRRSR